MPPTNEIADVHTNVHERTSVPSDQIRSATLVSIARAAVNVERPFGVSRIDRGTGRPASMIADRTSFDRDDGMSATVTVAERLPFTRNTPSPSTPTSTATRSGM